MEDCPWTYNTYYTVILTLWNLFYYKPFSHVTTAFSLVECNYIITARKLWLFYLQTQMSVVVSTMEAVLRSVPMNRDLSGAAAFLGLHWAMMGPAVMVRAYNLHLKFLVCLCVARVTYQSQLHP